MGKLLTQLVHQIGIDPIALGHTVNGVARFRTGFQDLRLALG